MVETRPLMSAQDFERGASHREANWWATGEQLIYRPEVMNLPGWRSYGSPDNLKLTEAQRCLMIWGDLVGQVQNGGLAQFFENYQSALETAESCVSQLGWPELEERYKACFRDYIHVGGKDATLKQWREHRGKERERYRREAREILRRTTGKPFDGDLERLDWFVWTFCARGDIRVQEWDYATIDAFNPWFYTDAVKEASSTYIATFARSRRDELVRISEHAQ
ncbi:MAG: hypothetical protein KA153_04315 [Hyphomonadaceae bacterium]|nr:hypothetical protein [Hyphomonadaceae bacterium]